MIPTAGHSGENKSEKTRDPSNATGDNRHLFQDEQKEDAPLHKCFGKARKGDFRNAKSGQWQFYMKDQTTQTAEFSSVMFSSLILIFFINFCGSQSIPMNVFPCNPITFTVQYSATAGVKEMYIIKHQPQKLHVILSVGSA